MRAYNGTDRTCSIMTGKEFSIGTHHGERLCGRKRKSLKKERRFLLHERMDIQSNILGC